VGCGAWGAGLGPCGWGLFAGEVVAGDDVHALGVGRRAERGGRRIVSTIPVWGSWVGELWLWTLTMCTNSVHALGSGVGPRGRRIASPTPLNAPCARILRRRLRPARFRFGMRSVARFGRGVFHTQRGTGACRRESRRWRRAGRVRRCHTWSRTEGGMCGSGCLEN
jgi:hypothetical protein